MARNRRRKITQGPVHRPAGAIALNEKGATAVIYQMADPPPLFRWTAYNHGLVSTHGEAATISDARNAIQAYWDEGERRE